MISTKIINASVAFVICINMCCGVTCSADELLKEPGFEVVTDGSGLEAGTALYTDNTGAVLYKLPAGQPVSISVNIKNNAETNKTVSVVSALYNDKNSMMSISAVDRSIEADGLAVVENSINVPAAADNDWSIKTYVLETVGNMYSYCDCFSLPQKPSIQSAWKLGNAFVPTSETAFEGFSALRICGEASECTQPITLGGRGMYKMSFFGKGDAGLNYGVYDASGSALSDIKQFEPCDDWELNSVLFKGDGTESAVLRMENDGSGSAYIDKASVSDDLIVNGGFENGSGGWEFDGNCFEISSSDSFSGKNSLKVTSNAGGRHAYQETDVIAHCKGMISFKSKCTESIEFKVLDSDSNALISKAGTTITSSSSWKNNYVFVNTMDYDKVILSFETKSASGRVSYIDDIKFTNLMYDDELVNSDFENGTEGWTAAYSTAMTTTEDVFSGENCCQLTDRTRVYSGLSQKVTDILNKYGPGSYYVEGYVRPQLDITGGWAVVRVVYTPSGGSETRKTINVSNPTAEWHKLSGVVDLDWDTDISRATISFETSQRSEDAALTSDLYIADVSFFKMPD